MELLKGTEKYQQMLVGHTYIIRMATRFRTDRLLRGAYWICDYLYVDGSVYEFTDVGNGHC